VQSRRAEIRNVAYTSRIIPEQQMHL